MTWGASQLSEATRLVGRRVARYDAVMIESDRGELNRGRNRIRIGLGAVAALAVLLALAAAWVHRPPVWSHAMSGERH